MSADDLFWDTDPLPVSGPMGNYDTWKSTEPDPHPEGRSINEVKLTRCEQCWRPVYGSVPGHVFCREHFLDHQRALIAAMVARRQQGAA